MVKKYVRILGLLGAATLTACTVGPDYKKPDLTVPERWKMLDIISLDTTPKVTVTDQKPQDSAWWEQFQDPVLNELIARAQKQNLDVKQALARVNEARALYGGASAALMPDISGSGLVQRGRNTYPGYPPSAPYNNFSTGFDAAWELDLWGGKRRAKQAAAAQMEAAIYEAQGATIRLLAEVVRDYIEVRYYQHQLHINHENTTSQRQTVALAETQWKAGQSDQFDVLRAESQLKAVEAKHPQLQSALHAAILRLGVLLGEAPEHLYEEVSAERPVPVSHAELALQMPAAILAGRPDIQAAERRLAAATAAQGVATAALFPDISISGFLGFQHNQSSKLFLADSNSWLISPSVSMPLLDFGVVRSKVKVADAKAEQAFLAYQKAVLEALAEVESTLVAYLNEHKRCETLRQFVATNERAVEIAKSRYKEGISSFLEVLDIERTLYDSQSLLAESEAAVAKNLVALYKALGVGYVAEGKA